MPSGNGYGPEAHGRACHHEYLSSLDELGPRMITTVIHVKYRQCDIQATMKA